MSTRNTTVEDLFIAYRTEFPFQAPRVCDLGCALAAHAPAIIFDEIDGACHTHHDGGLLPCPKCKPPRAQWVMPPLDASPEDLP